LEGAEADLDYDRFVREFLADILLRADEENMVALWLFTLELWYYVHREDISRQFTAFLRDMHWEEE